MDVARAAVAALCVLAAGCTTITMRIPRAELEASLARRFPLELAL